MYGWGLCNGIRPTNRGCLMPTVTSSLITSGATFTLGSIYQSRFSVAQDYPLCNVYLVTIEFTQSELPVGCVPRPIQAVNYPGYSTLFSSAPPGFVPLSPNRNSPNLFPYDAVASPGWPLGYSTTDSSAMVYAPSGTADYAYFNAGGSLVGALVGFLDKFTGTGVNLGGAGQPCATVDRYFFITNLNRVGGPSPGSPHPWPWDTTAYENAVSIGINDTSGILAGIFGGSNFHQLFINGLNQQRLAPVYPESGSVFINTRSLPCIERDWTYPEYDHRNQHVARLISHTGGVPDNQDVVFRCGDTPLVVPWNVERFSDNYRFMWCRPGVSARIVLENGVGTSAGHTHKIYYYNVVGKLINPGGTVFTGTNLGNTASDGWLATGLVTPPAGAVYAVATAENTSFPGQIRDLQVTFSEQPCPPHWATLHGDWCPGNYLKLPITAADFP